MEKKSGLLKYEPSSPGNIVDDITEMFKREESSNGSQLNDSQYCTETETTLVEGLTPHHGEQVCIYYL